MQFTFGNLRNSAIEIIERNDNLIYIIHLLGRKSTFFIVCSIVRVPGTASYIIKYYDFWGTHHIKPAGTL